MAVEIAEAGDDVDLLAERRDMIGGRKYAAGEQLAILITRRDHVLLGRLVHRQHVLVLVDNGVADDEHAVVRNGFDQLAYLVRARHSGAALSRCSRMCGSKTLRWRLISSVELNVTSSVKWMRPPCASTAWRSSVILPVMSPSGF